MGNKLGGQKSSKSKEERKREKGPISKQEKEEERAKKKSTKKVKKENKSKKKENKKAEGKSKLSASRSRDRNSGSEFDTDLESSHVTGGDSESGVFHSAENLSFSPYLDSHTRSELEHSGTWSAIYESSSTSRHPQVLSSRDFRDGFSLEACIPPEIARRDPNFYDHDVGSGGGSISAQYVFSYSNSSSLKSKRSNSTKSARMTPISARHHNDDLMSVSTSSSQKSSHTGREGYSTPLLTTPVFGRVDRSHSPSGVTSTLTRVQEADRDSTDKISLSRSPFDPNAKDYTTYNPPAHLAHLYQHISHTIDYRNLPKPTSPHPQRRALSPKMTSTPFKLISSDDSSSSPSTPVPQRKASNILAELLRSGRVGSDKKKQHKIKAYPTSEWDESRSQKQQNRRSLAEAEEMKKSRGLSMWKTWERSNKKKAEKSSKVSIFGTSRKTNSRHDQTRKKVPSKEGDMQSEDDKNTDRMSDSTLKDLNIATTANAPYETESSNGYDNNDNRQPHITKTTKSSVSSYENSGSIANSDVDYWAGKNRNSSPPVTKSAAFCIMRLEELERNIEKTIREKFPDAEPFLIRKRTPPDDSSRGSKSLPTTPSPKKKMLITHEITDTSQKEAVTTTLTAVSDKLGHVTGITRYYDETFEESVSPVMSPVVLRRFGARTRHASISPKIQRAKTAAFYNSPSEMERVTECPTPARIESPPNESADYHQSSINSSKARANQSYQGPGHHLVRQKRIELSESEDDSSQNSHSHSGDNENNRNERIMNQNDKGGIDTHSFDKPVIVPSFSAVFGSVSPKLKRHLQSKLDDQPSKVNRSKVKNGAHQTKDTVSVRIRSESVDSGMGRSRLDRNQQIAKSQQTNERPSPSSRDNPVSPSLSVRSRVATINKTMSEGWAGSREGSGGYPSHSSAHASDQVKATTFALADSANSAPHLRTDETKEHSRTKGEVKENAAITPRTRRKHSTDHVIFGSAVALPCRLYSNTNTSPPSSPERKKGTKNNSLKYSLSNLDATSREHTKSHASGVYEKNVKRREGQVDLSASTPSTSEHTETVSRDLTLSSDRREESNIKDTVDLSYPESDSKSSFTCSVPYNVKTKDGFGNNQSGVASDWISNGKHEHSFSPDSSRKLNVGLVDIQRNTSSGHVGKSHAEKVCDKEKPGIVLKQPVSKVIFDMINSSKQLQNEQQQQQQHQQQQLSVQQQRNWQTSPTTPEDDAIPAEPTIAMVMTPAYQQECLALEEKHIISSSICKPPSGDGSNLNTDEERKQTKESSTHHQEEKLHSGNGNVKDASTDLPEVKPVDRTRDNSSETSESSDLDRFLQSVIASEKVSSQSKPTTKILPSENSLDNAKQKPPPPSPTAAENISELLEEEEEEEGEGEEEEDETDKVDEGKENVQPRRQVNLALVRQNEMRAFSDEICQRLSDFLSSHTGSDEVFVGTDSVDQEAPEDHNEGAGKEDVFLEESHVEENTEEYKHDLRKHWENPGLLSELSEGQVTETNEPTIPINEPPLIHDTRPSRFSTSSSLSTSTSSSSSSSSLFAPPSLPPSGKRNFPDVEKKTTRKIEQDFFTYQRQEDDYDYSDNDSRYRRDSYHTRSYHSDDDVARGGGIPDYYDDKPLWKRQQKSPGQISIAMAAMRRRERRERWLKKRRRNKTDLLSTGSSDMGSEQSLKMGSRLSFGDSTGSNDGDYDAEVASTLSYQRRAMGSGILSSPKYSKPIMPFLGSGDIVRKSPEEAKEEIITPEKVAPQSFPCLPSRTHSDSGNVDNTNAERDSSNLSRLKQDELCKGHNLSLETIGDVGNSKTSFSSTSDKTKTTAAPITTATTTSSVGSHSHNIAIPGLEETFDELMSVKQILEELQDRNPTSGVADSKAATSSSSNNNNSNNNGKFMPLTVENIKSIREFYKDSSGNGRRSRMSNTDRTESDLDLFSEYRDDASTDSNLYADDEDDDDSNDPYATADDNVEGATGGEDVDSFVVSCTFYNSNSVPPDYVRDNTQDVTSSRNVESRKVNPEGLQFKDLELPFPASYDGSNRSNQNQTVQSSGASFGRSNSAPGSRSGNQLTLARDAGAAGFNSDDEFWAGRAAFERSYQQLETAADAVSSTFQNAREQMMDIQHHLQALRRQMEGLQDDLTSTSYTLTPDYSTFDSK